MTEWIYQDKTFGSEDIPEGIIGFVYLITLPDSRKYIGRKLFHSTTRKPPLKGKTRKRKVVKESDWKNYYGSSDEMKSLTLNDNTCIREILRLCATRSELSYYETKEIFIRDALLKDEYLNKWLTAQINGKNLKGI